MSDDDYTLRERALAEFLGVDPEDLTSDRRDETCLSYGREEYLVLTEQEADDKAREYLASYVDDCILTEIPENLRSYFDDERWIADVLRYDGRGPQLASYDGEENEHFFLGDWYYIYRTN